MGLSCTISEINGNFRENLKLFSLPRWRSSPWNWVPALGVKKLEWWRYRMEKEVWRYLQLSGYNTRTWQTDGQTPADSKDRAFAKHRAVKMDAVQKVRERRLRYFGHVCRMDPRRRSYICFHGRVEGERSRGRPQTSHKIDRCYQEGL